MARKPWYKQIFCGHAYKLYYQQGNYAEKVYLKTQYFRCMNCGKEKIVITRERQEGYHGNSKA